MTDRHTQGESEQRCAYWDDRYERIGPERVSWYQARPRTSLELIEKLQVSPSTAVIDVGGGASTLVDELVLRDFLDITILDLSVSALAIARRRLGEPVKVTWLHADLIKWTPTRTWGLWHDRALFHFMTSPNDQDAYLRRMDRSLRPDASFIIGAFALDGPDHCSGLPVERYDAPALIDRLTEFLGEVRVAEHRREIHTTPNGVAQPFIWIAGTRGPWMSA